MKEEPTESQPEKPASNEKIPASFTQNAEKIEEYCRSVCQKDYEKLKRARLYVSALIQWAGIAVMIGLVSGGIGTLFQRTLKQAFLFFQANASWALFLLPIGGMILVAFYQLGKLPINTGTNQVLDSLTTEKKVSLWLAPLIFVGTAITHFLGGSAGREGAALQLGGCVGLGLGHLLRLKDSRLSLAILCGMSGAFAALFGTPLTATILSLEVACVGVIYYPGLVPCLISSLVGFEISKYFGAPPLHYTVPAFSDPSFLLIVKTLGLALGCAVVCILFCSMIRHMAQWLTFWVPNNYVRIFLGGLGVIGLTFLVGNHDYNGAGLPMISQALNGQAPGLAFFWKILFTALTLGAGFKGGEIVPAFFVGATFGCVAGKFLGMSPELGAALGLIGVFCGVVNCPLASLVMSIELFGAENLLLFALVCGLCYMMSGTYGLYSSQKIVYSKFKPESVNVRAK